MLAVRWLQVFKRLFRVCRLVYIPGDWWTGPDASSRGTHGGRYAHETWACSQNRGQCECHEERSLERTSVICLMLLLLRAITWKANFVTCRLNFILWSFTCNQDNTYVAYHLSELAGQARPVQFSGKLHDYSKLFSQVILFIHGMLCTAVMGLSKNFKNRLIFHFQND